MKKVYILPILIIIISAFFIMLKKTEVNSTIKVEKLSNGYKSLSSKGFYFQWKVTGDNLNLKISAKVKGWIAVGFDPTIAMKNADIKMATVKNGKVYMRDDYGTGIYSHSADEKQNIVKKSGREKGGRTEINFTMPLNSGDKFDKVLVPGKKYKVIMACSESDSFDRGHTKRTSFKIEL